MSPTDVAAQLADDIAHAVEVARLYRDGLVTNSEALWLLADERSRFALRGHDARFVVERLRQAVGT